MAPPAEAQQPRTGAPIGFGFHRIQPVPQGAGQPEADADGLVEDEDAERNSRHLNIPEVRD